MTRIELWPLERITTPTVIFTSGAGSGAAATAAIPGLGMQFYYTMREGFYVPGLTPQPAVGSILPYLRPLSGGVPVGDPVSGPALTITSAFC